MTGEPRDARPLLQIVHVSDAHLVAPGFAHWPAVRALGRWARRASPALATSLERATAPHDPFALEAFERFLEAIALTDPIWRRLPTWFVDTGDATTFGDAPSRALAQATARQLVERAGAFRARLRVHGNHDLWPGALPLGRDGAAADDPREQFAVRWPAPPLCERAAHGRLEVQLYGLDTTLPPAAQRAASRRLAMLIDEYAPPAGVFALRIVASHHRAVDPLVAARTHVALSGHTHRLAPALGAFAASGGACALEVGSLSQRDRRQERGPWTHQGEILRVYASPSKPGRVVLERLVAARAHGVGPWRFVPAPGAHEPAEERVIALDETAPR